MRVSATLPNGVAALLFDSARRRREAEGHMVGLLQGAGFSEVILPILDYLEPYDALLTTTSRNELYRFIDRDGEQLALRADFTPMLARLLAPRVASLPMPLRIYYRGDVVRYEEERAGGQREFYQVGAELLGIPGAQAEDEVLRLFLEMLMVGGEGEMQIVLGFAGALDRLLTQGAMEPSVLAVAVFRRERSTVRQACPKLLPVLESGLPDRPEDLGPEAAHRLEGVLALRDELARRFPSIRLIVDLAEFARHSREPHLSTGSGERSYYDGIVFRAYASSAARPIGGGGRYDSLFRRLGAETPAVGFSLNLERLLEARSGSGLSVHPAARLSTQLLGEVRP
ncbi:MAG TPA: ATP phosphoribosyltransferase regulatory subunit [Thermoanaerobaculia bacterium]|nr:ATP phosphoribosyltransferase regulatory subunit [Thermoanaerobaculia bacterium]